MTNFAKTTLVTALLGIASPLAADSISEVDVVEDFNIIPTDAIRVEVDTLSPSECALQVMWALNLPEGSMMFHPRCEVVERPAILTSVNN